MFPPRPTPARSTSEAYVNKLLIKTSLWHTSPTSLNVRRYTDETHHLWVNVNYYTLLNANAHVMLLGWSGGSGDSPETPREKKKNNTNTRGMGGGIKAVREKQALASSQSKKNTWIRRLHAALCIFLPSIKTITVAEECARRFWVIQRTGNDPYVRHTGHLSSRPMSRDRTDECMFLRSTLGWTSVGVHAKWMTAFFFLSWVHFQRRVRISSVRRD